MTIKDKVLEPFQINYDGYSYQVSEYKGISEKGNDQWKVKGYYSSVEKAVKEIARLKIDSNENTYSLSEYIKELSNQRELIQKSLKL